ncbi:Di-copper centre-containing protein [Sistotremastrum niveocremeum HHB9708]|uniref:tyrosinase n=1 Tax=Sistotremastrum niveocremeum HHB9708 TaxID=1314777 RepID=A0A164PRN3_9AGAM|nr:Di-copper centre-containing protein [Sistotremastrum niveocremeum HHB9708]
MANVGTYAITGIPVPPNTPIPIRREIHEWASNDENKEQVALFLLAFERFQRIKPEEKLSYFKIAGIHGLPREPWDGAEYPDPNAYYCAHSTILFPTWHRPYLLLFEQRIHEIMINDLIPWVEDAKKQVRLTELANSWRLPYWDWGVRHPDVAAIVREPNINKYVDILQETVGILREAVSSSQAQAGNVATAPDKIINNNHNPVYSFQTSVPMKDLGIVFEDTGGEDSPYSIAQSTSRHPPKYNSKDPNVQKIWIGGIQNNDDVTKALNGLETPGDPPQVPLWGLVYRLMCPKYCQTYEEFATVNQVQSQSSKSPNIPPKVTVKSRSHLSLESIHNNVHVYIGGGGNRDQSHGPGHMSETAVSAFDPIFWFHHCNVDRLLAIWQTLYPDRWIPDPNTKGDHDDKALTSESPLSPFHVNKQNKSFTSNTVRDWTAFGYTYPELPHGLSNGENGADSQDQYISGIRAQITALYGPSSSELALARDLGDPKDFVLNVEFALGGLGFVIHFFLQGSEIGQVTNFSSPISQTGCENCQDQQLAGAISTGQVVLSAALYSALRDSNASRRLKNLDPDTVASFLDANVTWKIYKLNGEEVEPAAISLNVTTEYGSVHYVSDPGRLPIFEPKQALSGAAWVY